MINFVSILEGVRLKPSICQAVEGATKKNLQDINVGNALLYARLSVANRDL